MTDVFREVDEEVRREQLLKLWRRHSKHVIAAIVLLLAVAAGLFEGLACFADHAEGGPSVRRLLGVWRDVVWQPAAGDATAGAAVGRLTSYETALSRPVLDLIDHWLSDGGGEQSAGGRPEVGVSLVFYPRPGDGRTVRHILMVESADVVMFPASAGSEIVGRTGEANGATAEGLRAMDGAGRPGQSGTQRPARAASHSQ